MLKKVVIAAAGRGTRMKHLTNNKPKHVINVQQKPFLHYLLDNLVEAGYQEIILIVGYKAEKIRECLKDHKIKTTIINQFEMFDEKTYGTLIPLKCAQKAVGQENFLMLYGDNLYSVRDLKNFNIDDNYCYVAGFLREHPEKYGVLVSDNGFLTEIIEKPKEFVGNLINTGLYKLTPEIFKKIPQVKLSQRGEYELTDAISLLAKDKKVKIKKIEDYWLDFGNPADIIKLSRFFKENGNYQNQSQ